MDCSPPGFSDHGISQARILEWFAISSPYVCIYVYVCVCVCVYTHTHACVLSCFSCVQLLQHHGLTMLTRLLCPWNFPGKNTGVGCHFLLQGTLREIWQIPPEPKPFNLYVMRATDPTLLLNNSVEIYNIPAIMPKLT